MTYKAVALRRPGLRSDRSSATRLSRSLVVVPEAGISGPPSRLRSVLHSLRQRLQDIAEREAAGEAFWTPSFSERVRTRVMHAARRTIDRFINESQSTLLGKARQMILEQEGLYDLTGNAAPSADFFAYYHACDDAMFPSVLEAMALTLDQSESYELDLGYYRPRYVPTLIREINEILAQERVGWELIDGRMVEIHSKELHEAAIEPALRLLHTSEFAKADKQYRDALEELAQGKATDAITDAGATLQEVLEVLGCEGNQLGDLIRSARKKRLLGAHDTPLLEAIDRAMHWVAADRSEMGDAHHATEASREDAWLIVHVVGALVVRLASRQERSKVGD